jgi:hypothetical protein
MPDEVVRGRLYEGWTCFVEKLEEALNILGKEIDFICNFRNRSWARLAIRSHAA